MFRPILSVSFAALMLSSATFAQTVPPTGPAETTDQSIDCDDPDNAGRDLCLGLPIGGAEITNFAPIAAPLLGASAVAAALGGGGNGTVSTVSTVSTTN